MSENATLATFRHSASNASAWNGIAAIPTSYGTRDGECSGVASLGKIGTVLAFRRNKTIFNEGDPANYSYRVGHGAVRLCKVLPDGRRQIAHFFLPGDFFGLGDAAEYGFAAEAVSDVTVVCYPRHRIDALCDERPDVRKEIFSRVYRELSAAQNHLVTLGRQTAKERVASFLLVLAERANSRDGDSVELPMGRQDIADYLGLTIETVCRALTDLKRCRLITTPNIHQVQFVNLRALQSICEPEIAAT
jgi:CRP-like cAMP-binding protein